MKSSGLADARIAQGLGMILLACCLSGPLSSFAAFAQQTPPPANQSPPAPTPKQATKPPPAPSRQAWRKEMSRRRVPKKGCFTASYPDTTWREVPCGAPSPYPNPPARGPRSDNVGNGTDFVAHTSGLISSAVGSFNRIIGTTSVNGEVGGSPPPQAGVFMLQLNTQFFPDPPACNRVAGCRGWQQFLFSQTQCSGSATQPGVLPGTTPCVFMEDWLLGYGPTCPAGQPWISDGSNDCWFNSPGTYVPPQTVTSLAGLILTASTSNGQDQVVLTTTSGELRAQGQDSVLTLGRFWNSAEFNVFGDCCSTQAVFNRGSTIVVTTSIDDGTTNAPSCVSNGGTTAETNNLTLVSPCTASGAASPAIEFTESFGGPPALSGPFVDTYAEHDQQHFAYLDGNGDVWDAYHCPGCSGNKWQLQKINDGGVTPSGPPAASAPFANVYSGHDQQHFAWLATSENGHNGEIWDAFWCPGCSGNHWQKQKINNGGVTPNGPPAASAPFVDVYAGHDQQHFAWLATNENGRNGEIWDAFYCSGCSGNKWRIQQISGE